MLIETKPPSPYPRWDVRLRAVVVAFVLPAMQMEHLALSCGEELRTKACWEESACSFTQSWLGILPSDWLHARSSLSPPSAGFLSFHESRNIWKQLQCETTGSGWRLHEFRSGFVIATTSHEVPCILIKLFHASSNRKEEERVSFFISIHLHHWFYLFSHLSFVLLVILHLCLCTVTCWPGFLIVFF